MAQTPSGSEVVDTLFISTVDENSRPLNAKMDTNGNIIDLQVEGKQVEPSAYGPFEEALKLALRAKLNEYELAEIEMATNLYEAEQEDLEGFQKAQEEVLEMSFGDTVLTIPPPTGLDSEQERFEDSLRQAQEQEWLKMDSVRDAHMDQVADEQLEMETRMEAEQAEMNRLIEENEVLNLKMQYGDSLSNQEIEELRKEARAKEALDFAFREKVVADGMMPEGKRGVVLELGREGLFINGKKQNTSWFENYKSFFNEQSEVGFEEAAKEKEIVYRGSFVLRAKR